MATPRLRKLQYPVRLATSPQGLAALSLAPLLCIAAAAVGGWPLGVASALALPAVLLATQWRAPKSSEVPRPDPRETLRSAVHAALLGTAGAPLCVVLRVEDLNDAAAAAGPDARADALAEVARRLSTAIRGSDTVIRLDEPSFAFVLDPRGPLDLETIMQIAARLQAAVSEPIGIGSGRVRLRASLGLADARVLPQPDAATLIDAAETALIEARCGARGAIRVYSPAMRTRRDTRESLVSEAARALDRGEIRPWFQPQVSTDTGRVTGFEALARWHHPDRGTIAPAEFLPALEAGGLMERLGEVMVDHALRALAAWDADDLDVPCVGVNLSPDDLRNPALASRIAWQVDRFDLTPDRLAVEVLESVVATAFEGIAARNIAALSGLGCRVDLDDFGTGHASITSLRRLHVDRVKIDRSFVAGVDTDREQQKMVAAILGMCENLGIAALAEGVETAGEHAMLAQLGCAHVQGYAIARPMPFAETAAWLRGQASAFQGDPTLRRRF